MALALAPAQPEDRAASLWDAEVARVRTEGARLAPGARDAVARVLWSLLAESRVDEREAAQIRRALAAVAGSVAD